MESGGDNFTFPFLIFSSQTFQELKEKIQTHEIIEKAGIEQINVLLVGQVSAGKSAFVNSVESVFVGYVTNTAASGADDGSLTKKV